MDTFHAMCSATPAPVATHTLGMLAKVQGLVVASNMWPHVLRFEPRLQVKHRRPRGLLMARLVADPQAWFCSVACHCHCHMLKYLSSAQANLPWDIAEHKVANDFATAGDVLRVEATWPHLWFAPYLPAVLPSRFALRTLKVRQKTHQSTATIRYGDPGVAASVVSEWHHTYYCGRRIIVDYARRG